MIRHLAFVLVVTTQIGGFLTAIAGTLRDEGATEGGAKNTVKDPASAEHKGDEPKAAGIRRKDCLRWVRGTWSIKPSAWPMATGGVFLELHQRYRRAGVPHGTPTWASARWHADCKTGADSTTYKFTQNVEANVLPFGGKEVQIRSRTTGGSGGEGDSFEERLNAATGKLIERSYPEGERR